MLEMKSFKIFMKNMSKKVFKMKISCMNCEYYWASTEHGFCVIDDQDIHPELSHIVKCQAFSKWFGAVE
jgi:hypothetical protein